MLHCIVYLISKYVLNKKEKKRIEKKRNKIKEKTKTWKEKKGNKRKEKEVCFCNAFCIV